MPLSGGVLLFFGAGVFHVPFGSLRFWAGELRFSVDALRFLGDFPRFYIMQAWRA